MLCYYTACVIAGALGGDPSGTAPLLRAMGRRAARAFLFVIGFHCIAVEGARDVRAALRRFVWPAGGGCGDGGGFCVCVCSMRLSVCLCGVRVLAYVLLRV